MSSFLMLLLDVRTSWGIYLINFRVFCAISWLHFENSTLIKYSSGFSIIAAYASRFPRNRPGPGSRLARGHNLLMDTSTKIVALLMGHLFRNSKISQLLPDFHCCYSNGRYFVNNTNSTFELCAGCTIMLKQKFYAQSCRHLWAYART